jgi:hypothetical protein
MIVERFVGTFGIAIRKLAENDHLNWHKWLPLIELAYNTAIDNKNNTV